MVNNRCFILWQPNTRGEGVIGYYNGMVVFPSQVGQNAPTPECISRANAPEEYDLEECVPFQRPGARHLVAYPAVNGIRIRMPGIDVPLDVVWETNVREGMGIIASVVLPELPTTYFRIFLGDQDHIGMMGKRQDVISTWEEIRPPQPNDSVPCYLAWITSSRGPIVGYAYPAKEATEEGVQVEVELHRGVAYIEDHILVPGHACGVTAFRKDGKLYVVIE